MKLDTVQTATTKELDTVIFNQHALRITENIRLWFSFRQDEGNVRELRECRQT